MLEGRTFGVPKKREPKIDPYEGRAVLIIHPAPEKKGETYKFELSPKAITDLELVKENAADEKLVSFSFDGDNIQIGNTTTLKGKISADAQHNVSMNGIFSNKVIHEYISELLQLDPTKENELDVILLQEENEIPIADCIMMSVKETETTEDYKKETSEPPVEEVMEVPFESEDLQSDNETF